MPLTQQPAPLPSLILSGIRPVVSLLLVLLLLCLLLLNACGYHNPNVMPAARDLPPTRIYAPMWTNATSEMGLEMQAHNAINDWLAQSGRIVLVAEEQQADYLLRGRISSVRYPGFSYDTTTTARSLTAVLTAAVTVEERESGRIIWQNSNLRLEETYNLSPSISQTDANKRQALFQLVDSMAEQVYLRLLRSLSRETSGNNSS